jgi:hypothetical protein
VSERETTKAIIPQTAIRQEVSEPAAALVHFSKKRVEEQKGREEEAMNTSFLGKRQSRREKRIIITHVVEVIESFTHSSLVTSLHSISFQFAGEETETETNTGNTTPGKRKGKEERRKKDVNFMSHAYTWHMGKREKVLVHACIVTSATQEQETIMQHQKRIKGEEEFGASVTNESHVVNIHDDEEDIII